MMTKQAYAPVNDPIHKRRLPALQVIRPADLEGKEVPPRLWCVPDWFPDRAVSLLTGDGGTGKSLLAMQLATSAALGLPFLGMELAERNVLYVACEDDPDEMHRRQHAILESMGCSFADLGDRLRWVPLIATDAMLTKMDKSQQQTPTATYTAVRELCRAHAITLVIIDTAADTFGGLEIDRQQVTRYVRHLEIIAREINGAVVLLSHPSVAGLRDRTGTSGSTAWRNAVRAVVTLTRPDDNADADFAGDLTNVRILERLKGNYSRAGGKLTLLYEQGTFALETDGATAPKAIDQISLEVKVEASIKALLSVGKQPSPSSKSSDYAVRMLQSHEHCRSISKANIERAIGRMTGNGSLRVAHIGTGKNARKTLVPASMAPLPDERDPLTGERMKADQ